MFRRCLFALFPLFAASALLAQAYKWTDEEGVVHYSDRPQEGAVEIQLPTNSGRPVAPPVQTVFRANNDPESRPPPPFQYEALTVASPVAEETLWNIGGVLNVVLNISPALQPGHTLNVYFDGAPITVNTPSFQLEDVFRGTHNLQAEIVDQTGRLMIRSENSRFYVQQTSVIRPN